MKLVVMMDDDDDEWVQMMIMMTATATTTATPATSFYLCVGEYILWTRSHVGEDVDSIVLTQ